MLGVPGVSLCAGSSWAALQSLCGSRPVLMLPDIASPSESSGLVGWEQMGDAA